ncbi:hypothetical protein Tco_1463866 [Tanacetum coccineum]
MKEEEESSEDAWRNYLPNDEWEHYEHKTYIKTEVNSNYDTYNNVCQMFKNRAGINNDNDLIQTNQEWFDDHERIGDDDDDIGDLDDYLIPKDAPYYVDEEEEGFKERRSKLFGIPIRNHQCSNLKSSREVLNINEESSGMQIIWNLICVVHAWIQTLFTTQQT